MSKFKFTKLRDGRETEVSYTTTATDAADALNDYALHFGIGRQRGWEYDPSNQSLVRYSEYCTIMEEVVARPITA